MRTNKRPAATALAAALALSIVLPVGVAHADSATHCAGSAQIFAALPNGTTRLYKHTDPVGGTSSWDASADVGGPSGGRLLGGPNGYVYNIKIDGDVVRYRWNGSGWDTADGSQFTTLAHGWTGWDAPQFHNRITMDAKGDIYQVPHDGGLYVDHYDAASGGFVEQQIDTNWGSYDLILAAGAGTLYARDPSINGGQLYRYQYDTASQRWSQRAKVVSTGWNIFSGMFSPGGDTLYGHTVDPHGDLLWYHYTDATNTWAGGNNLGWGWDPSWEVTALADTCSTPITTPVAPAVASQPQQPTTLVANSNGHLEFFYIGGDGSTVVGDQADVRDPSTAHFAALPGYQSSTGRVAAALNDNGTAQLLALGMDGDSRGSAQSTTGSWLPLSKAGGYFPSAPTLAHASDGTLVAFGIDSTGGTWYRPQASKNGVLTSWRSLGGTGVTGTPTAVVQGNTIRLIALDPNGIFRVADFTSGALSAWTPLAGITGTGSASAVLRGDSTLQVFARDNVGSVRTIRQNADGTWPSSWSTIAGVTAAGAPSAVLTAAGTVELVVRAGDGYIYNTGPAAAGSTTYRPWSVVSTAGKAVTDPSAALMNTGTWVVSYRDADDRTLLFRATQANAQARSRAQDASQGWSFVGGALPPRTS
ncbi:tachylectin-related carbohydrate-binding protein [Kutzneria sp. NPDC052558]|uniref:tachylectin-related carbohydrate-binding protein n=1 Tax=Kutzneria sp. NPDC052558 TaxID=3364121 RepID=UPI0037C53001